MGSWGSESGSHSQSVPPSIPIPIPIPTPTPRAGDTTPWRPVPGFTEALQRLARDPARYAFRGPLSDRRILSAAALQVAFRYLDHRSRTVKTWRGTPATFVARHLQHALPHRFHRIRHYGFYAPGRRADLRALQLAMLTQCGQRTLAPAAVPPPGSRPLHPGPPRDIVSSSAGGRRAFSTP
jgi:hypothetical protein